MSKNFDGNSQKFCEKCNQKMRNIYRKKREKNIRRERGYIMQTTIRNHMNPREAWGSLEHVVNKDFRNRESHVDPDGFYEVWEDNGVYETYKKIFGEELEKFNKKQKRKDRRILDENGDAIWGYMQKIKGDARGQGIGKNIDGRRLLYEVILSAGNVDKAYYADGRVIYDKSGHEVHPQAIPEEVNYRTCKRFYEGWREMFPRLELVAVGCHGDEGYLNARGIYEKGTQHTHFNFIPWADGYQRGLPIQANIYRALEQMGYHAGKDESGKTRSQYYFFTQDIQKKFEDILQDEWQKYREREGLRPEKLEIVHPDKGKDRRNMAPEEFKEAQENQNFARKAKAEAEQYKEEKSVNKAERDFYAGGAKVGYADWLKWTKKGEEAEQETKEKQAKRDAVQKELDEIQEKKRAGAEELQKLLAEIQQKQVDKDELQRKNEVETAQLEQLQAEALQAEQKARESLKKADIMDGIIDTGKTLIDGLEALKSEMTASQRARLDGLNAKYGDMVAEYEAIHEGYFDSGSLER